VLKVGEIKSSRNVYLENNNEKMQNTKVLFEVLYAQVLFDLISPI
jgi:hypothetical protein